MNTDMKISHKIIKMTDKNISASFIIRKINLKLHRNAISYLLNIQKFNNMLCRQECEAIETLISCW